MGPACRFDLFSIIKAVLEEFWAQGARSRPGGTIASNSEYYAPNLQRQAGWLSGEAGQASWGAAPAVPTGTAGTGGQSPCDGAVAVLWLWLAGAGQSSWGAAPAGWLWMWLAVVAVAGCGGGCGCVCGCGWLWLWLAIAAAAAGCGCDWLWQWLAVAVRWLRLVRLARAGEPATSTAKGQGSRKCYSKSFIFKEFTDFS